MCSKIFSNLPLRDPTNIPDPYVKLYLLPERAKDSKRKTEVSPQCGCLFIWSFYYKLVVANVFVFCGVWCDAHDWWIRWGVRSLACPELHIWVCAIFYYTDFLNQLCSWCECLLLNQHSVFKCYPKALLIVPFWIFKNGGKIWSI